MGISYFFLSFPRTRESRSAKRKGVMLKEMDPWFAARDDRRRRFLMLFKLVFEPIHPGVHCGVLLISKTEVEGYKASEL